MEGMSMDRRKFVKLGTGLVAGLTHAGGIGASAKAAAAPQVAEAQRRSPLRLELKNNQLRFGGGWCEIPEWRMGLEVGNKLLQTTAASAKLVSEDPLNVEFHFPEHQLTWCVKGEIDKTINSLILRSTIRNESQGAVALGKAFLLQTNRLDGLFNAGDDVVYLPISSGQRLNQVQKLDAEPATNGIAIQAFNQSQNKALQVGFVTFQRAKTQVEHSRRADSLQLKAWCEFDGWELQPGTSTPTETLILAIGENPHAQLVAWGDRASLFVHGRPREWEEQPHGWVGWSWVDGFDIERYEDVVLRNAKAVRQRLAGFGVDYVWVSIGNIKDGQPGDWLSWNDKNFPNGPDYLHDQLKNLGFKWGLWCGAFMLSSKLQDRVAEFGEALFKKPDGKEPMIYMPRWAYGLDSPNEDFRKPIYALDPSHPRTLEYLRKVFQTYRDWGVRYYMIDFLEAGADTLTTFPHAKHHDKELVSGPEVFQKGLQAIRDACGDDTHLLASSGPTIHTAGVMDSVRTGNDFCEGRALVPGAGEYPGTFAINSPGHWSGPVHALSNQASSYFTHRRLYINNSGNVLTIDKPVALNQAQMFATIHVMSGGPTMLGDDIGIIDEERLGIIKKTLPRPRDVAVPVDLFTRKEQGYPRVYHRKVVKPCGSYDVVAVYNLETAQSVKQDLDLKSVGLDESRTYHVWEFWSVEYVGKVRGRLNVEVPPYTVKVYRLTEDTGQPVILGTDMHVLMGETEIDRCNWDSTQQALSGRAIRPPGESGSVFIYGPPKMGVANPKGYFLAKDVENDCLIIRCPLRFDEGWAEWNVKFFNLALPTPRSHTS
jgi:hypothetical protein